MRPPRRDQLVVQCGRVNPNPPEQSDVIVKGYNWRLDSAEISENWGAANSVKPHVWQHQDRIVFRLRMPPGTAGKLRMLLNDPDKANGGRKVKLLIDDKAVINEFAGYDGPKGKWAEYNLTAADTKTGEVRVTLENLNKATKATVSTIEFLPQ